MCVLFLFYNVQFRVSKSETNRLSVLVESAEFLEAVTKQVGDKHSKLPKFDVARTNILLFWSTWRRLIKKRTSETRFSANFGSRVPKV